jgi:hypothetical protein
MKIPETLSDLAAEVRRQAPGTRVESDPSVIDRACARRSCGYGG